ncbi:MAG: group II intron reverse transcriptase/maturase, partial [Propionibacteriaceae bacterium]|nr:group II intron reverse transcriptase/maturase [Propionibacteriaceae bacterium]
VLDDWFEHVVKSRLRGQAYLVRYADDFAIVFEHEDDSRRVMTVLPKRCDKYGLTVHLLGFTHYWGRSRRGTWVVKRKTASKRLTRAVQNVGRWCRANRHEPITDQHAKLSRKIIGHYAYYGITGNGPSLRSFLYLVHRVWHRWLNRRHRKRNMNWQKFNRLLERYPLPPIRVVHSVYARAANP